MKTILILAMSCNSDFYVKEESICKKTWMAYVDKFENIDCWIYTASSDNKFHVNKKDKKIYVPISYNDSRYSTFEKTCAVLKLLPSIGLGDFDYIFRTNLSTYINIPLLNMFVLHISDRDVTYCTETYITKEQGPTKYGLFP